MSSDEARVDLRRRIEAIGSPQTHIYPRRFAAFMPEGHSATETDFVRVGTDLVRYYESLCAAPGAVVRPMGQLAVTATFLGGGAANHALRYGRVFDTELRPYKVSSASDMIFQGIIGSVARAVYPHGTLELTRDPDIPLVARGLRASFKERLSYGDTAIRPIEPRPERDEAIQERLKLLMDGNLSDNAVVGLMILLEAVTVPADKEAAKDRAVSMAIGATQARIFNTQWHDTMTGCVKQLVGYDDEANRTMSMIRIAYNEYEVRGGTSSFEEFYMTLRDDICTELIRLYGGNRY